MFCTLRVGRCLWSYDVLFSRKPIQSDAVYIKFIRVNEIIISRFVYEPVRKFRRTPFRPLQDGNRGVDWLSKNTRFEYYVSISRRCSTRWLLFRVVLVQRKKSSNILFDNNCALISIALCRRRDRSPSRHLFNTFSYRY